LVLCTDVFHHSDDGEFISAMAVRLDVGLNDVKNWDDAMRQLLEKIEQKKATASQPPS
jgi:hypothetical protein